MKYSLIVIALLAEAFTVTAFPFVAEMPGVDASLLRLKSKRQQSGGSNPGGPATCPFNSNHVPAPGITAQYPYNGAKNGLPGKGVGGYQVPAPGDTAHYFVPPGPNDIVRTLLLSLNPFLSKRKIKEKKMKLIIILAWSLPWAERCCQPQFPGTRWNYHLQRAR
jgi:hypothetical protein